MKIKIWGARGSVPSPLKPQEIEEKIYEAILGLPENIDTSNGAEVRAYLSKLPFLQRSTAGGNTCCIEIQTGNDILIIDAGSGLRELGLELMKGPCGRGEGILHIIFTHAHWDHIQGFPFFRPAFIPGNKLFIYSIHDLETVLENQQQPITFPVSLSYMQAQRTFIPIEVGQPFTIGNVKINTIPNYHPGVAYGLRFEDQHSTFVFASDAEYKELKEESIQPYIEFFRNADALIFDAQYALKDTWSHKADWGHSSALIGVDMALRAGAKKLLLFHHDPTCTDKQLEEIQNTAQAAATTYLSQSKTLSQCEVLIAYEGLTLDLTPPGAVELHRLPHKDAAILTPTSVFDKRGVNQLAEQLAHLSGPGAPSNPIIDLSQVETLSITSLKSLITLHRQQEGAQLVLANPSTSVQEVIKLSGFLDVFAIYPSLEAAFAAIQAREALNLPGQMIAGRYRIENKIGDGRLGTVLKATDTHLNKLVALKVFSPSFSDETVNRLMQQSQQITNLNNRNIVNVFYWGKDAGYAFKIEEFMEAKSLQTLLSEIDKPLPADQAIDIALDITLALEYAHSRGVIHGDLTPSNIFLTPEGAKLSGFGLGHLEEGKNLRESPLLFLTAHYLAPEQILGQPLDARTDLYALGIIFYQLFTGQLPFTGTDQQVMEAQLHQSPHPPRDLVQHLSLWLEHLILKLLAKSPHNRYDTAQQTRHISSSLVVGVEKTAARRGKVLVGRKKILEKLVDYWHKANDGYGQLAFISGELGIGKTSLAQQAAAKSAPPVLLIGYCQDMESSPYHPFISALRVYFKTIPQALLDETFHPILSNFAHLIPEVQRTLPDLPTPPPLEAKQEKLRLIASITQFIKLATQNRPWFLIIDDLQWADQNSLELLRYLAHHLPTMNLFIVATYHDAEMKPGHPLRQTLHHLKSQLAYHHFPLSRLDKEDVTNILTAMWKDDVPDDLIEKIYQHTGGNPFYVEEVARSLVDDEHVVFQKGTWHFPTLDQIRLPETVRDTVWRRILHLSSDTQMLLREASVLGETFKFDDLKAMSALDKNDILEHLDMALARNLIHEVPGDALLRFNHTEVRHVLYADLTTLRRRLLHLRAAEALERENQPNPNQIASQLAYHFSEAGLLPKAILYNLESAHQAKLSYANQIAIQRYKQTLTLIDKLDSEEAVNFQHHRLIIHQSLGEILALTGNYDKALRHYTEIQTILKKQNIESSSISLSDRAKYRANLSHQIAEVYEKRNEYNLAFEWLEKGLKHVNQNKPTIEVAHIYLLGAGLYYRQSKYDQAMAWCEKSLAITTQLNTRKAQQAVGRAYYLQAIIYLRFGKFSYAIELCKKSVNVYQQINDIVGQTKAYNNLGIIYSDQGNWEEASKAYHQSLIMREKIGDIYGQARTANNLGNIHLNQGNWIEAVKLFNQSLVIWQQVGTALLQGLALSNLAQVHLYQKNWQQAQSALEQSHILFTSANNKAYMPELTRRWAEFYLYTNQLDQALTKINESIQLGVEQKQPLEQGISYRILGEIQLACNENELAYQALKQSHQILTDLDSKYELAKTNLILTMWALKTNLFEKAKQYLTQATQTLKTLNAKADLNKAEELKQQL